MVSATRTIALLFAFSAGGRACGWLLVWQCRGCGSSLCQIGLGGRLGGAERCARGGGPRRFGTVCRSVHGSYGHMARAALRSSQAARHRVAQLNLVAHRPRSGFAHR